VRERRLLGRSIGVPIAWLVHLQPLSVRPSTSTLPSILPGFLPLASSPGRPQPILLFGSQSVLLLLPGFDATPSVHSFWAFSLPSAPCHVGPETIGHWTLLARLLAWCFQAFSLQLPLLTGRLLTRPLGTHQRDRLWVLFVDSHVS